MLNKTFAFKLSVLKNIKYTMCTEITVYDHPKKDKGCIEIRDLFMNNVAREKI